MGTVTEVNFGARRAASRTSPNASEASVPAGLEDASPAEQAFAKKTVPDVVYLTRHEGNLNRLREACDLGDIATDFIFGLAGFQKKDESVELRQAAIAQQSLEELTDFLLSTDERMWREKPHYIGAVILEMHERIRAVGMCCPELDMPSFKG